MKSSTLLKLILCAFFCIFALGNSKTVFARWHHVSDNSGIDTPVLDPNTQNFTTPAAAAAAEAAPPVSATPEDLTPPPVAEAAPGTSATAPVPADDGSYIPPVETQPVSSDDGSYIPPVVAPPESTDSDKTEKINETVDYTNTGIQKTEDYNQNDGDKTKTINYSADDHTSNGVQKPIISIKGLDGQEVSLPGNGAQELFSYLGSMGMDMSKLFGITSVPADFATPSWFQGFQFNVGFRATSGDGIQSFAIISVTVRATYGAVQMLGDDGQVPSPSWSFSTDN